jgi:hypothetical protein
MSMKTAGTTSGPDGRPDELVSQLPDLTAVSLEQAQSFDASVLSYAVQRVLEEADAGIGHHLAGYNPSAAF